ncbi:SNF2 family N-terminal domain-containing protein [Thamnidium elegans]|nr:SNF2 family N-terminal domain-containing protein [Thamnidium elegans]
MSHQQGQGIPLSQQQYGQQQQSIDEQDLFTDYQQLFVDTHPQPEFNNNGFYNNSPQYPTHFIPQETSQPPPQQFNSLLNFSNNNNNTATSSTYQGSYDGVPISGPNHQPRIYDNMTNQLQNFAPMHQQHQYQHQQQLQQQMLIQRQQQLHLQQQLHRQKQQQQQQQQQQHHHQQQQQQHQFHQSHQYRPPQQQQQQQQQQILFQQQQQRSPIPSSRSSSQKRSSRNTKRKVKYDESTDDEPEDLAEEDEDEDEVLAEASDDSDFESNPTSTTTTKKVYHQQHQAATDVPVVMIPMATKTFEKMLDYRINPNTRKAELLVKYKYASYHHVEWLPKEKIEAEHLGKHRVKKFLTKWNSEGQKGEDYSEYLKVDRIIDEGELADPITGEPSIFYLVKWNGLFYDASTWESEDDVQKMDASKIHEFQRHRIIPQEKLPNPPKRPDYTHFIKYNAGIKYKFGNELRSYQLEGLNWIRFCYYNYRSCILADEMGLGKTVQSVAFLNDLYYQLNVRGPFLIVAPLSTIPHWERAFRAWTDLNVIDYRGSVLSRSLLVETEFYYKDVQSKPIPNRFKFDVLITTYEMASVGAPHIKDIPWKCAVFDEAHRLKNKQSKVGEILKGFSVDHKLLLTGTPLQNNLDELYSLLNFMQPEIFNNERAFFTEYGNLQTAHEVEKLQALLKPIMLRRFKEDVEKSIPVKEETVIEVELTNPQKKWYRAILEKNFSFLRKGAKSNKEMPHLRNIMMQLRKCCIHPYLLEGAEEVIVSDSRAQTPQEQFSCLIDSSGKLVLIDKLLRKLFEGNHKVLIFSQFTSCLDILSDYLRGRQYPHERIDGSVPGDQRQAAIDRFSTLPINQSFVFLLCTRAGGVGINLTAADTCIIFDSDWNPQNDLQAQARCHRIGQTKPVQVYRLICRNTYEKDMFDRAGMKLGLDKAVMQRMDNSTQNRSSEENSNMSKNELNRKEIEALLKKGAYGAVMDDEESQQFCEEDIDQILERRTTVIRHEGNEKGSIFSKATFSSSTEQGVELDDPDFWEKWAAKANLDVQETPDENGLIVYEPRRRRQVQRFGTRNADGAYSSNDNADDSDAYEDDTEKSGKRDLPRPWTLSEKTKYERKLMIYGYGPWQQMQLHFPRRTEKDLKFATRYLMRKVRHVIEPNSEEDRKLLEDIDFILESDNQDQSPDETVPYLGASKKHTAEFRSFLIQAPADYIEHIERKGRNFLLRIQMLHMVRDRIVPKDWEAAKILPIPKVTGSLPCDWWGEDEDRDLLLGICKHGYQQYLTMRKDKEFCFYGKKFDDSKAGTLQEDDEEPVTQDETYDAGSTNEDVTVYVWPSKADIGMRLRRIIAAFLREQGNETRRRRGGASNATGGARSNTTGRSSRRTTDSGNRWQKKNRGDFMRTILSFGVETIAGDPNIRWNRFREISGLENRTDASLDLYYYKFIAACKEIMKKQQKATEDEQKSRESSEEAATEELELVDTIPYDKARRALKRVDQMKKIREQVVVDPDYDASISKARKTSGLPPWWEVPLHDKALLEGICKHGIGRHDLMVNDTELPFHRIVQKNIENSSLVDPNLESTAAMLIRIAWPKELVIQRRIDALCELILRPKQPQKRQIRSRKRKTPSESSSMASKTPVTSSTIPPPHVANRQYLSDIATDSEEEEDEEEDEELNRQKRARYELYLQQQRKRVPTKPLKSQGFRNPSHPSINPPSNSSSTMGTPSTNRDDEEMEDGEIAYSDDEDNNNMLVDSAFAF